MIFFIQQTDTSNSKQKCSSFYLSTVLTFFSLKPKTPADIWLGKYISKGFILAAPFLRVCLPQLSERTPGLPSRVPGAADWGAGGREGLRVGQMRAEADVVASHFPPTICCYGQQGALNLQPDYRFTFPTSAPPFKPL